MSPEQIARRAKIHNAVQLLTGVVLIPTSIFLWWLSFLFFRIAFSMPLSFLFDDVWTIGYYLAWLCMIPLAIEGFRRTRPLFEASDYIRSDHYHNFGMLSDPNNGLRYVYGNPIALAYWVSQVLYSAPRTMVLALRSLRSFLPASVAMAHDAARILGELRASRKWTPAENYKQCGASLLVLERLHLIWTERKTGQLEIRYPAGMK